MSKLNLTQYILGTTGVGLLLFVNWRVGMFVMFVNLVIGVARREASND